MKFEICILAGGLSTRMGRDKARLRLGRRSMLSIIRETAKQLESPVRVIRRDRVPRCGPMGGIITALKTSRGDAVLFLACDMPLVSVVFLRRIVRASRNGTRVVFAAQRGRVGFPFVLPASSIASVQSQIAKGALSLHELAIKLAAHKMLVPARSNELFNVNTAGDAAFAKRLLLAQASLVTRAVRPYGSRHAEPAHLLVARGSFRRQRQR